MQLLNTLSRLQWAVLLLLNLVFIPTTIFAAPKASFIADPPKSGLVPLVVRVNCKGSSPWEGPDRITRFEWTTSTGRVIKNIVELGLQLENSGQQTITLTVWNAAGESNSTKKTFDVCEKYGPKCPEPPPPPPPNSSNDSGSTGSTGSTANFEKVGTEKVDGTDEFTVHLKALGLQTGVVYEYRVRLETDVTPSYHPLNINTEEYSINLPEAGTYKISLYEGVTQLHAITVTVPESVDNSSPNPTELKFEDLEDSYKIGETVKVVLVETGDRKTPVDLWVAIEELSSNKFNFLLGTDVPSSWSLKQQLYKTIPVYSGDTYETDIDFEFLSKDFSSGKYTFYAAYVEKDKQPLTNGTPNEYIRSSVFQEIELKANMETPAGENLAELAFKGLKDYYNVGVQVVMELVETGNNRDTSVDLWVAIQLPSGEILFRTDMPMPLNFWTPWSPNLQPHKTSIEIADTNHHIFDFELPEGIGGKYTLYAVYVEENKQPVTNKFEENKDYYRSELVIREIFLANK
jgi:hypothetical protein